VIGEGTVIEAEAAVEALAVVGRGCRIGRGARLHPHAVVYDGCEVGERAELHAGAVLGADGFGYASRGLDHRKVPQVGRAVLEADVEMGANSAVDRGALGETRVGAGSKIDNLVQVGHNCRLGRGVLLSGLTGLAGSTVLGDGVVMGGASGASGHLEIGAGSMVAGASAVFQSLPPGSKVAGTPAKDLARWRRETVLRDRLGDLVRRVRALERRLGTAGDEGGEGRRGDEA
jgi:UDP-3-O-[3-hydroxymyristoyl] glucosamine N-acyltransferase